MDPLDPAYGTTNNPMDPTDYKEREAFVDGYFIKGEFGVEKTIGQMTLADIAEMQDLLDSSEDDFDTETADAMDVDLDTLGAELGLTDTDFEDADDYDDYGVYGGNDEDKDTQALRDADWDGSLGDNDTGQNKNDEDEDPADWWKKGNKAA